MQRYLRSTAKRLFCPHLRDFVWCRLSRGTTVPNINGPTSQLSEWLIEIRGPFLYWYFYDSNGNSCKLDFPIGKINHPLCFLIHKLMETGIFQVSFYANGASAPILGLLYSDQDVGIRPPPRISERQNVL